MTLQRGSWLAGVVLMVCGSVVLAQDLGLSNVKAEVAREVGISYYRLVVDGDAVSATVFKKGGDHLADCAIEFTKTSATAECDLTDEGKSYRWKMDRVAMTVTFEDVTTGELVTGHFDSPPIEKGPIYVAPGEEPPVLLQEIEIEANRPMDELSPGWKERGRLVGLIVGEVMHTLDIQYRDQGASLDNLVPSPPQGIQALCVPPDRWVCQLSLGWPGIAQLQPDAVCCSIASQVADRSCKWVTDRSCCANSLCNKFCIAGICNCTLQGYPYECQINPCV